MDEKACNTYETAAPQRQERNLHDRLVARIRSKREQIGRLVQQIDKLENAVVVLNENPQFEQFMEMID